MGNSSGLQGVTGPDVNRIAGRASEGPEDTRPQTATESAVEDEESPASPWLYLAGLIVTLSGLFAVNYGHENPTFAMTTYAIAVVGYATSYSLRRLRLPYESLRTPLIVLVCLGLFAWLSTGAGETAGDNQSIVMDRSHAMQIICVWLALLQPFAAFTDMAVLFSCVPCMSLIALVSTTSPDVEIQHAFLAFVAAATFLMVHENYLRTRSWGISGSGVPGSGRKLFGGQLQLAVGCVVGAFVLANLVAVPMRAFGTSLSLANNWGQASSFRARLSAISAGLMSNDSQSLAIGTGPVAESDTIVMRVEAPAAEYWRGTTYDYYTGSKFENRLQTTHRLASVDESDELTSMQRFHSLDDRRNASDLARYNTAVSAVEPVLREMTGGKTVDQKVTVLLGGITQCYGAGWPVSVNLPRDQGLVTTDAGGMFTVTAFPLNAGYRVRSITATDDPGTLRSLNRYAAEIPPAIADHYLQKSPANGTENTRLRDIAEQVTRGQPTTYDKVAAIHSYIIKTCKYNLQAAAAPTDSDRVEYFLTGSHQGYCDSFAAAMTMLCRYAGIPSRLAAGYLPGDPDGKGGFLVRQKHKHAWTEVYFPHAGWVTFDPTDGSDDISNRATATRITRVNPFAWLFTHGILPPIVVTALVALIVFVAWTELAPRLRRTRIALAADGRAATNRTVLAAYTSACVNMEKRGLRRPYSATPTEFLHSVRAALTATSPAAAEALTSLTALHDRFLYGDETASEDDAREAVSAAMAIRTALSRVSASTLASLRAAPQTT